MTLTEFRQVFHGPLIGNCGYTQQTAEEAITAGNADLISFGRLFISNQDLAERFMNGWPLSEQAPMSDSPTGREGYTDFPAHVPPSAPGGK
jgi:N-ethylmaleimide reductase